MKRLLASSVLLLGAGMVIVSGATGAFFSDTETSSGNTFTAGAIDLLIDNTSYYNGVLNQGTTWTLRDLTIEKFFDFDDIKPGDIGEDTISLHVNTNDAFLCAEVTLTSDNDNGFAGLESEVDQTPGPIGEGELADAVTFLWWADDGDNVLEQDEDVISQGPIGALALNVPFPVTLADSETNIWEDEGGPIPGNSTRYIGKGWCFGELTLEPVGQDGPIVDEDENGIPENGPDTRGAGFSCDGEALGNETQSDSLTADVSFSAVQARHNQDFLCEEPEVTSLTLIKEVDNLEGLGVAVAGQWTLSANTGPTPFSGPGPVVNSPNGFTPGAYDLAELGPAGYTAGAWTCVGGSQNGGQITLAEGESATCTIENTFAPQACIITNQEFADAVVDFDQGTLANGGVIGPVRSDPTDALFAPTALPNQPYESPAVPEGAFVSLGFGVNTDATRSITLEFTDNVILNGSGDDLLVYEITNGSNQSPYPDEHAKVEASQDGIDWVVLTADSIRDISVDLGPLAWAKYVRITDVNAPGPFLSPPLSTVGDGYDLDAVEALNCATVPVIQ